MCIRDRRKIKRVTDTLNRQGLRVVAVATKYLPAREGDYQRADESDLILEGYIAFLDPPKETTAPALKALKASGITVKILTGDSELVAAKVCQMCIKDRLKAGGGHFTYGH